MLAELPPGSQATLVSVKVAKTIDAQSGQSREDGRQTEDGPTRSAQASPAKQEERPSQEPPSRRQINGEGASDRPVIVVSIKC